MRVSDWHGLIELGPREYTCGFCGKIVSANKGYFVNQNVGIVICPNCAEPTYFNYNNQQPGPMTGKNISKLPNDVAEIYKEIRETHKNGQYTATLLLGRKLVMHLAIDVTGAKEGLKFVQYVDHLKASGYVPPKSIRFLENIKDLGNEKNHELKIGTKEEADSVISFTEVLLIFMYEYGDTADDEKSEKDEAAE